MPSYFAQQMACILFDASHGAGKDQLKTSIEALMHSADSSDAHDIAHYQDPTSGYTLATLLTEEMGYSWSWAEVSRGQPQVFKQLLAIGTNLTVPDGRGRLAAMGALSGEGWLMGPAFKYGVDPLAVEPATGRSFLSEDFASDGLPEDVGSSCPYRQISRALKKLDTEERNRIIERINPLVAPIHQPWWSGECAKYLNSQVQKAPSRRPGSRL